MLVNIFDQSSVPVLEQSVKFAQARQKVLAGNFANMDTPGYKIRDLNVPEFHARLKEAVEARNEKQVPLSENLVGNEPDYRMRKVSEASKHILFHDKSDFGLEQQVLEMSKNQGMHNTAIAILSSQFRLLNVAISERV